MNRRTAIRKAVGLSAVAAALPVLSAVAKAQENVGYGACNSAPTACGPYTPPPPDTRTPEEVITEQEKETFDDIVRHLTHEMYPGTRRYAYSVWHNEFVAVRDALNLPVTIIKGYDCLVGPNGNVVRRLTQTLHLV